LLFLNTQVKNAIDVGAGLKPATITVCKSLTYLSPSSSVISVIAERLQEMGEGPLRHVPPLLSRLGVGEAEMDALVDTGCDHIIGGVRETAIGARLLGRLESQLFRGDFWGSYVPK
jgi:hypothetical protein